MEERISDEDYELARVVCTAQQFRSMALWRRGFGWKAIAMTMDIDRSTARQHVKAGVKRLANAQRDLLDEAA